MSPQHDQISDEELAESIDDKGILSSTEESDGEGLVESFIQNSSSDEEKFSADDFDISLETGSNDNSSSSDNADEKNKGSNVGSTHDALSSPQPHPTDDKKSATVDSNGDVAEFRKTLSDLSRQLEIDRITLLHNNLRKKGQRVPDLSVSASDIKGETQLHPIGDEDLYSKRPFSRLQGWIVGLSFGVGRRAKKFRK